MPLEPTTPDPEVLVEVADGVGRLTLNRPRAINALTRGMCATILDALGAWAGDPAVASVELVGAGERGLCSGADVRALRQLVLDGGDWEGFFATEYAMNAAIAHFPKPYVAQQRGITMGGGLGVSAHGSRRVAHPDSAFAMPETIIGFVPDVGILGILAHAPGELRTHLALTGATIGASDAGVVGRSDEVAGAAAPGVLEGRRAWIDDCYAGSDAAAVLARLEAHADPDARAAAAVLRTRSPLSVCVTLEAIRRAGRLGSIDAVLAQDAQLVRTMVPAPDFSEGVRAQLVDKDRSPRWQHARVEDVTRGEVLACFGEGADQAS